MVQASFLFTLRNIRCLFVIESEVYENFLKNERNILKLIYCAFVSNFKLLMELYTAVSTIDCTMCFELKDDDWYKWMLKNANE